ncbi:hypothetical protein GCM10010954_10470 [Halobacillus andaensis]|uniref:DUF2269 family protein n=1 Tax=Halobacillus andaensis TaxID=1176239 RepID=A0A917AZW4_HALAA|nr:DUF2269 family protein [Halobacillus andaensis]MBP2003839.1 hypothetical protein [Halobacillus andaensis]GGF13648.1 hypothetical protein GCM10010954_10470 [Halobacillus andaensis]
MFYNVVLFLHILGTVVMFAAVGVTVTAMAAMLYANKTESLREWSSLAVKMDILLPFSVIIVLVPGLFLVFSTWGWGEAWVNLSLAALLLMTFMGPLINLPRLKAILAAANKELESTPSLQLQAKVKDRVLWHSVLIMTLMLVAILFLMTVKPVWIGSLITLFIAIGGGFIAAPIVLSKASSST